MYEINNFSQIFQEFYVRYFTTPRYKTKAQQTKSEGLFSFMA
jgi:hypothetical protein